MAVTMGFGLMAYRLEKQSVLDREDQALEIRLGMVGNALQQGGPPNGRGEPGGARPDKPPRKGNEGRRPAQGERPRPPDDEDWFWEEEPPPPPRREDRDFTAFQTAQMQQMFNAADRDPCYFIVWNRDGRVMTRSANAPAEAAFPSREALRGMKNATRLRDGMRELYHFTPPGDCLLVGKSSANTDRYMHEFAVKVTAIGGALLMFGLAVGWWISSRALRPITDISRAAERIAQGHFNERIQTQDTESELGELAALLDDTFQRLDAAIEEQARFTSDAAHELRTPVSVILAQSQLALSRERSAESYRATIEMSQRAAQRMHGLIESLLQLAVLDTESSQNLQACDLALLCRETLPLLQPLAEEKHIVIDEQFASAPCRANPDHIAQVLINLVGNAVKHCPEETTVHVLTGRTEHEVFLSVRDNGPGIAADHLPQVFERFYRTDKSRNRATGGSGLGLAICRRIAEAHGGAMSVHSVLGAGTEFTLKLPLA